MRFFHLGDLHFGKLVHLIPMEKEDQPYWIDRFLEKTDEYKPDAIVIAGDVYDKRVPSPDAVKLFDYFLTELCKRDIVVLMIAGNHDSGVRLSFAGDILKNSKIHIVGEVTKDIYKVSLPDEYGNVNFYLMPYLYPRIVADPTVLNNPEINGYDQAVRALLSTQNISSDERNVILVHQNVLNNGEKPEHSESETIVGGLGEVDVSAFDAFDYVAMGHIHNAQAMGRETVRYAGCPLYYDFSEEKREKYLTMVDMDEKGSIKITKIDVPLLHKMKRITGMVEDIIAEGRKMENISDYYIQAVIQDRHLPAGATDQLKAVFGDNIINIDRKPLHGDYNPEQAISSEGREELSISELFSEFFKEMNEGMLLNRVQEDFMQKIYEQQNSSNYHTETEQIPEKEIEELIAFLMKDEGADA